MNWRVAKSLLKLRDQVDAAYPGRDKSWDGTIGDERHQATNSDHNPNSAGVVTAMDITNDPKHGLISGVLAETLRKSRDHRIKYIISNRRIASSYVHPWEWRPYYGSNPHDHHVHVSVVGSPALWDDTRPWDIGTGGIPAPEPGPVTAYASGKGSWYSQYVGKYVWVDRGDEPGSAALGVPDSAQGVSFYNHLTLGKWFEVKAPNGQSSIEQQTDIGPSPYTGRKIDISSAAAERFGYSPRNFPTDETFYWQQIDPPASVANLTPQQQAITYRNLRQEIEVAKEE